MSRVLDEMKFSFPMKTVFINGKRIPRAEYEKMLLKDGDRVEVIHMMSGG